MAYKAVVRVTFKEKKGKDADGKDIVKRYSAKRECEFYDSTAEAVKELGERNSTNFINEQIKTNFANSLRDKLKAKVTGEAETGDIEDVSELLDD